MKTLKALMALLIMGTMLSYAGQQLTVTLSGYLPRTEVLTNFPALVVLGTNIPGFSYSQFASTNGYDLRFYEGNNPLDSEMDTWGMKGDSNSYVWIRIPYLTGGNRVRATWGDSSLTSGVPLSWTNGSVWDSTYGAVWHFNQTNVIDSTSNRINASSSYDVLITNSLIGRGLFCLGTGGIQFQTNTFGFVTEPFSFEYWVYPFTLSSRVSEGQIGCHLSKGSFDQAGYYVQSSTNTFVGLVVASNGLNKTTPYKPILSNVWQNIEFARETNTVHIFYQGIRKSATVVNTNWCSAPYYKFLIGQYGGESHILCHYGLIDEMRVRLITSSTNYVWANYMTQASNSLFQTYSPVMPIVGGVPYYRNQLGYESQL